MWHRSSFPWCRNVQDEVPHVITLRIPKKSPLWLLQVGTRGWAWGRSVKGKVNHWPSERPWCPMSNDSIYDLTPGVSLTTWWFCIERLPLVLCCLLPWPLTEHSESCRQPQWEVPGKSLAIQSVVPEPVLSTSLVKNCKILGLSQTYWSRAWSSARPSVGSCVY